MPRKFTVFKIGGSLFDLPGLPNLLRRVLALRPDRAPLLVAGGGQAADAVREWDRSYELADEAAHWLAIQSMDLATGLLSHFFPEARLVRSPGQAQQAAHEGVMALLCAECFIKAAEARGHAPLERSWRTTSDSIAAWAADIVGAELVLVKSLPLPCGIDFEQGARLGFVDECFPEHAAPLAAVGWVNGRGEPVQIINWQPREQTPAR